MLEKLEGSRVSEVFVSSDTETMFLVTDKGIYRLDLDGDCCSETWFSDIYNFDALIGTIGTIQEIDLPDYDVDDGRTRQCEDCAYGIEVVTDKGVSKIVFRNSSNGYYGGNLNQVAKVSSLPDGLTKITEDWKA